jgi:cysteine desulfurase
MEWLGRVGDPGRVHTEGRMVRAVIEDARAAVADLVGARPRSVIFTSGATEAIATACHAAPAASAPSSVPAVVCAPVEHSAVRDASVGARPLGVDGLGRIVVPSSLEGSLKGVQLVHCQWGNHEVGTLQPVSEMVEAAHEAGARIHVDAAAACGQVPIAFDDMEIDLMSISAHKLGGPPGVGALIIRRGLRIPPLLVGGSQERGRRAGMENVPGIAGFGVAAAGGIPPSLRSLSSVLLDAALAVPGVVAYGDVESRLPHIVCVGVTGVEAEAVLLGLDQAGIAAHSGSACSSEVLEPSPVLEAMGVDAQRSLRLSVGWSTTISDVDAFRSAFPGVVARLRALAG